jgi:hypothetical protein
LAVLIRKQIHSRWRLHDKVDEELEKEGGKEELAAMKRKNPPNKAPLFKLLGDINGTGGGPNGEQT